MWFFDSVMADADVYEMLSQRCENFTHTCDTLTLAMTTMVKKAVLLNVTCKLQQVALYHLSTNYWNEILRLS